MTEPLTDSELAQHFRNSAVSAMPRAPLNAAIARIVAEDPELRGLLLHAPRTQQLPVLLLASVHATLLELVDDAAHHDLVYWYPNLTEAARAADDRRLASVFRDFVTRHRGRIVDLVRTRHTQTNEVGRSALLLVAMGLVAADIGESAEIAHLDVGASGGLNLLIDRLAYRRPFHVVRGRPPTLFGDCLSPPRPNCPRSTSAAARQDILIWRYTVGRGQK